MKSNRKSVALALISLTLILGAVVSVSADVGKEAKAQPYTFTIDKTWDNRTTPDNSTIYITFSHKCDTSSVSSLFIEIDAPFYNDPEAPNATIVDPLPGLWDYEVVEAFFLGNDDQYLEIELAPSGHYLLLYLNGYRNDTNMTLPLTNYTAHIMNSTTNSTQDPQLLPRWMGQAFIPLSYFPTNVTRFNAYAIHNSGDNRTYMSLFPVDSIKYPNQTAPDFHFLEAFEPIGFETDLRPNDTCTNTSGGNGMEKLNLFGWTISALLLITYWNNSV